MSKCISSYVYKEAEETAKRKKGELWEFPNKHLERGEDHKGRGKLIKDYSKK